MSFVSRKIQILVRLVELNFHATDVQCYVFTMLTNRTFRKHKRLFFWSQIIENLIIVNTSQKQIEQTLPKHSTYSLMPDSHLKDFMHEEIISFFLSQDHKEPCSQRSFNSYVDKKRLVGGQKRGLRLPYARHYKPRHVNFSSHFSLRFIFKSS